MKFVDSLAFTDAQLVDGQIRVSARAARAGNIQLYLGSEMGVQDKQVVRVYRPVETVFDKKSMATFPHKIVTLDHPEGFADFERDAVGWIGDEVARDGEFIRIPMVVAHKRAIEAIDAGKRELSVGYAAEVEWGEGTTPDGQKYDAAMKNIVVDHVAIVDHARGGSELRIGDGAKSWGVSPVNHQTADERKSPMADNLRKVLVDGLQVETTDAGATAIEKLTKDKAEAERKLADAASEHTKALAAKDAEIAAKDAEIEALKASAMSDAELDKRAAARADLIGTAKAIVADVKTEGLTDADIRKAVVVAKLGDAAIKDKSEAYIDARFDILAEDAKKPVDPVRAALMNRDANSTVNDNGQSAYEKRLGEAWKKGA